MTARATECVCRGFGIVGSGVFLGMTLSVSSVTLPMILRQRTIKPRERVELFKDMYELTVARWLPIGVLASLSYFAAAYFAPAHSGRHAKSVLFAAGAAMISIAPCTLLFVMEHVTKLKGYLKLADSGAVCM
ncbi:hypothetical protein MVES_003714 [Malassezia vespertilionis]|uniref:Uncharacterized protein n=1 Tax=Malassezia vespertilionis TaxID=2020962 RepID=A0A2N1J7B1_9BASI|nr:hypothetical protein MVES_003714 [Malassezia vespertilionis]